MRHIKLCLGITLLSFSLSAMTPQELSVHGEKTNLQSIEQIANLSKSNMEDTSSTPVYESELEASNLNIENDTPEKELSFLMTAGKVARVLCLDGGGIRGVFSAKILEYIEERIGMPIVSLFHLLAGTSTGGLLATALSVENDLNPITPRLTASNIVDLYTDHGSDLFQSKCLFKKLFTCCRSMYDVEPLEDMFLQICGNKKLSDITTDLLITYHNLTNGKPAFFKSHFAREASAQKDKDILTSCSSIDTSYFTFTAPKHRGDFYLRDVLRATSAAPTFFDPLHLTEIDAVLAESELPISAIDGGLFANDPSLCALTEAFKLYPNSDAYLVISIGTGKCDRVTISDPKTLIGWAKLAPVILMSNAELTVKHMMKTLGLIYSKKVFYLKIQVSLPEEHSAMDDASSENIEYLKECARMYISNPDSPINSIIELLRAQITPKEEITKRPEQNLETNFRDLGSKFVLDAN